MAEATKTTNEATAEKSIAAANLPMVVSESPGAMLSLPAVSAYPQLSTTPNIPIQMKRLPSFGKGDGFKIGVAPKTLPAVHQFVTSVVAQLFELPTHMGADNQIRVGPGTQNEETDTRTPAVVNDLMTRGTLKEVNVAIACLNKSISNRTRELQLTASASASATSASAAANQSTSQERHLARIRREEGWLGELKKRSQDLEDKQSPTLLVRSEPQQNKNGGAGAGAASTGGNRPPPQEAPSSSHSSFDAALSGTQVTPAPTIWAGNNFAAAVRPGFMPRNPNATLADRFREQQQPENQSGTASSSATAATGNAIPSNRQPPPGNQQPGNSGGSAGSSAAATRSNATSGNQQPENKRGGRPPGGKK